MTLYRHPDRQPAACLPMQPLTILTVEHPRAAAAALSPSRGRKGKRRKTRFPLRESAAVAAKGCTGWSVAMTRCCHPDRQTAACLPMQSLTILTVEHPRATSRSSPPQGGAREILTFLPGVKSHPLPQNTVYICLYFIEVERNITICIADNQNAKFFQICSSFKVIVFLAFFIMLTPVYFYGKFGSVTVKIKNICIHNLLTRKTKRMVFKKCEPELSFMLRHVFTKLLGVAYDLCMAIIYSHSSTCPKETWDKIF